MPLFMLCLIIRRWPKSGKGSSLKSRFGKYIPCTRLILEGPSNSIKGWGEELNIITPPATDMCETLDKRRKLRETKECTY